MEQITAASIVALFETNKEQRRTFVGQIIDQAVLGNQDALRLHKQVKAMEEIVKAILSDDKYQEVLLDEAYKHGKSFKHLGDDWSIKETGVKYIFDNCNDPILKDLMEEFRKIEEKLEKRKDFLKSLDGSITIVIEETGEIVEVFPPAKTSKTTVAIKMT